MNTVRCSICRLRFQKLKLLFIHYLKFHSKIKIIQKLLVLNSRQTLGKLHKRNTCNQDKQVKKCKKNNTNQTWNTNDRKCEKLSKPKYKPSNKRKIKKKKVARRKKKDYHIRIAKLKDTLSLDEQSGFFYACHCRENDTQNKFPKNDPRLITSDTESCSETSKNSFVPIEESNLFCNKCGSGYKTESELSEHMYVHEPFCRLCNLWFSNEFDFKQHMQLHKIRIFACHICSAEFPFKESLFKHFDCHMEEKVLNDVLELEEEYKTFKISFLNTNYITSINSIMCYLKDRPDMYYCDYKYMKTNCDICYKEIYFHEYERHLQIFHSY